MKRFAIVLLVVLAHFSLCAQINPDVDTFMINNAVFIATTPTDWFSTSVNNGIQQDTTWNYKMRHSPKENASNTYAEIWIHVTNNSKTAPTRKQQREFKKKCTVVQTTLGNWGTYFLTYKGESIKNCRSCGILYTRAYSVPLNFDQTLELVFIGQGTWAQIQPLEVKFSEIASQFVRSNESALSRFKLIDFTEPFVKDTFEVDGFQLYALIPTGFIRSSEINFSGPSYYDPTRFLKKHSYIIEIPSKNFQISVFADATDTSLHASLIDTTLRVQKSTSYDDSYQFNTFVTSRVIYAMGGKRIIITFQIKTGNLDAVWEGYLKITLRDYANRFSFENMTPRTSLKKLDLPVPNSIFKPLEAEKKNKLEKGLPKPK